MDELDLNQVRSFVQFAERLSFTKAAHAMNLSQPALHTQIKKLQEGVGASLYRRVGRGVELTPAGGRLLLFGREILAAETELLADLRGEASRPVRLAAGEGALLYLLADGIRAHRDAGGRLSVTTAGASSVVEAVVDGSADVGVVAGQPICPASLSRARLVSSGIVAVLGEEDPLSERRQLSPRSLVDRQLILPPAGSALRASLFRAFAAAGLEPHIAAEATGWPVLLRLAEARVGVALVNAICDIPEGLVAVPFPALDAVDYEVLWRSNARGTTRALVDVIRASIAGARGS